MRSWASTLTNPIFTSKFGFHSHGSHPAAFVKRTLMNHSYRMTSLLILALATSVADEIRADKPNIIIIYADDLGMATCRVTTRRPPTKRLGWIRWLKREFDLPMLTARRLSARRHVMDCTQVSKFTVDRSSLRRIRRAQLS